MTAQKAKKRKARILVVDDVATVRKWLSVVLENAGYEVISTENPVLVVGMVFQKRPDLVLLDLRMPLLHGDEVFKCLVDAPGRPLVVFYSGEDEERLREVTQRCQADGFIRKDGNPTVLLQQVEALLATRE